MRRRSSVRINLLRLRATGAADGGPAREPVPACEADGAADSGEYRRSKSSSLKVKPTSSSSIISALPSLYLGDSELFPLAVIAARI